MTDGHDRPLLVGVDIGGSKIAVLVVDRDERVLARQVAPTAAGDETALAVTRAAGRALGAAVANLIGILDVREIVVHGTVTALGEPWLAAIRDEATRRSLGPLARETRITDGGVGEDLTLLGACALLLTRELGLTVHR